MPIKCSEISGFLVEKKEMVGNVNELAFESAWNACRKEQGSVKLTLNRDKLEKLLSKSIDFKTEEGPAYLANILIEKEHELFKVVK